MNRYKQIKRIEYLYWQYARRKFYCDIVKNNDNISEWKKHYFNLFKAIASSYCNDFVIYNSIYIKKELAFSYPYI